jgi:succinate dehydrogenase/fumarate reductase-like Fe-S protein
MELNLEVFFFKAGRDYLPYFKKFKVSVEPTSSVVDILSAIKALDRDFNYPLDRTFFRINGLVVDKSVTVEDVVKRFGKDLKIEPLSSYRAKDSLVIDDSNFHQNFEPLKRFCDIEDIEYYNELYGLFFASESFNFNKEYIGDAVIILADRLINKNMDSEDEILKIITQENGLWDGEYENNMFKEVDYTSTFDSLKEKASNPPKNSVFCLLPKAYRDVKIPQEFGVALYGTSQFKDRVKELGFKIINFEAESKKCGISMLESNEKMALLKAGRILSSAFDSGADILVIEDKKVLDYFKNNFKKIEKLLNRELNMNLYSIEQLSKIELAA